VRGAREDCVQALSQRSLELGAIVAARVRYRDLAENCLFYALYGSIIDDPRSCEFGAQLKQAHGCRLRPQADKLECPVQFACVLGFVMIHGVFLGTSNGGASLPSSAERKE